MALAVAATLPFRARREHRENLRISRLASESRGQNLALTVLHVPNSIGSGTLHPNPQPHNSGTAHDAHDRGDPLSSGEENNVKGFDDFLTENSSSHGQDLALTGLCVPSSLESG